MSVETLKQTVWLILNLQQSYTQKKEQHDV